jgi:hypothetical protein
MADMLQTDLHIRHNSAQDIRHVSHIRHNSATIPPFPMKLLSFLL